MVGTRSSQVRRKHRVTGAGPFPHHWDHGALCSLPQRAAYWAGALDRSERGDPLAVEGTTDRLLESIHKAACLQMMDDPKPVPFQQSPMMISVDAERMTPLIRGLPNSLQLFGI